MSAMNLLPIRGGRMFLSVIFFVLLSGTFSVFAYEMTKTTVSVTLDGEKQQISAHADSVKGVLAELDVKVNSHDVVEPALYTEVTEGMNITWNPAMKVQMTVNGETKDVWTTAETVAGVIAQENINVDEHGKLEPGLKKPITEDLAITYERAFQVHVNVGGKEENTIWTTSTTVADLLKRQDITLGKLDRVKPEKDQEISEKTEITVTRVKKVTDVVEKSVDYAVVKRKDNDFPKGREKIIASGEEGRIAKHYEVVLENGEEVSRELIKTETIKESSDRIVAVGTKVNRQPSRGGGSGGTVVNQFYAESTAYTAYCTGCSGTTHTGINLRANPDAKVIAVDPNVIPLGTKVWVEGYGYAVAGDIGSAINGQKIDVFFPSKSQAYGWGRRRVLVKILD